MADTVVSPEQMIADFGGYYLDAGQSQDSLMMRPFTPFGTLDAFTIWPTNDTILRMGEVLVGEILQAYQDEYTPKGQVVFKPITINMFEQKIDQAFNPTKLYRTWGAFLTSNNTDRTTWPFPKWFIEKCLLGQVDEDLETKAIYTGTYVAPATGVAGAAINAMDGVKKIINAGITAGAIVPIATGALPADPVAFVDAIEAWISILPVKYQGKTMQLNLSIPLRNRWRRGMRKKYNMNYGQVSELDNITDFESITIAGRVSMGTSNKIWMTPKENAIAAVKGYENKNGFQLEKVDRKVKVYTDWFIGVGFLLQDLVFTNDQDLAA